MYNSIDKTMVTYEEGVLLYYLYRYSLEYPQRNVDAEISSQFKNYIMISGVKPICRTLYLDYAKMKIKEIGRFFSNNYVPESTTLDEFQITLYQKFEKKSFIELSYRFRHTMSLYTEKDNKGKSFFSVYNLYSLDMDFLKTKIEDCNLSKACNRFISTYSIKDIFDLLCLSRESIDSIKYMRRIYREEIVNLVLSFKKQKDDSILTDVREKPDFHDFFRQHSEQLLNGDFNTVNSAVHSGIVKYHLIKYKQAYELLGKELVAECNENPVYICNIINSFNIWSYDTLLIMERRKKLEDHFRKFCPTKKNNKFIYYAYAFADNEKQFNLLCSFYENKDDCLSNVSRSFDYSDKKNYLLMLEFAEWCGFSLEEEIEGTFSYYSYYGKRGRILELRSQGVKLDEICEEYFLTHNEIKHIEQQAKYMLSKNISKSRLLYKLIAELNGKKFVTKEDIKIYDKDHADILFYLLKKIKTDYYEYISQNDMLLFSKKITSKTLGSMIKNLPCIFSESQIRDEISGMLGDDAELVSVIEKIMVKDYIFHDGYYFSKKTANSDLISGIVRMYFPDGIRIYKGEDLSRFRSVMSRIYGSDNWEGQSNHNLSNKLRKILTAIDKGIYIPK